METEHTFATQEKPPSDSPFGASQVSLTKQLSGLVVPLVAIELALTLFTVLLMGLSLTIFDYRDSGNLTPFQAIGLAVGVVTIPIYFTSLYGIVRQRRWGRWAYVINFTAATLADGLGGLFTASEMWDFAATVLRTGYVVQGGLFLCLFADELNGFVDRVRRHSETASGA